ncbi:toxin-antitoxin system YwqK family antitoxin [Acinetobacter silvestris]|uniref:Toxin-antitoxin system YwqK family antitoxin n=1 Tax=Acinetobacter silvestris TaxID=1977882 RepID=A0A1Y3CC14_9GAMM|nr:toxin-antitoxin system YwqK family antitoxin [Acinetobacter silvestris]OTG64210.1 hypothetical protein B9T28_11815 [Acinetobacter silvestris]
MNKILLTTMISFCSLHTFANGYMNENMIIFSSESDGSNNPWQGKPKCIPVIKNGESTKTWSVQYTYLDHTPLTSKYLTTQKPSTKPVECEHQIHFPDGIQDSGIFESFYPNGKPRSRIEYTDGTYNGDLKFWFANGLKEQESTVRNGASNGAYRIWHPNGQLALSMGYKDDMQNGMKQRWYENGEPWTYVRFENNKMVGELKQWYRNGKLERLGAYRDGVRHGTYKTWYADGTPEAVLNYQAGKIMDAQCWDESAKSISTKNCISKFSGED